MAWQGWAASSSARCLARQGHCPLCVSLCLHVVAVEGNRGHSAVYAGSSVPVVILGPWFSAASTCVPQAASLWSRDCGVQVVFGHMDVPVELRFHRHSC